jgi:hypothetical protein
MANFEAYSIAGFAKAMNELDKNNKVTINLETFGYNWSELASHIIDLLRGMKCDMSLTTIKNGVIIEVVP